MNLETLFKYLEFLRNEFLKYSKNDRIDDNELDLLLLEINKFIDTLKSSTIENSIKEKVFKINFQLKPKIKFIDILTSLLSYDWYYYKKKQENLAKECKHIAQEIENTIFDIKAFN